MPHQIIDKTIVFVKETLAEAEGGHDWHHTERVWNMARHLREEEGKGDLLIIELAALLHDISDAKFNGGDDETGSQLAYKFLLKNGIDQERSGHIRSIIRHLSFKGGFPQEEINSIEFQIVQDADRLDAIGAIGIARAFNYGGFRNRPIYDPTIPLREYEDSGAYHRSEAPTINHFYEKLLLLKELMNTRSGKQIAVQRHQFMLEFLEQFYYETSPEKLKRGNSG
jgi:uncharacterized protein